MVVFFEQDSWLVHSIQQYGDYVRLFRIWFLVSSSYLLPTRTEENSAGVFLIRVSQICNHIFIVFTLLSIAFFAWTYSWLLFLYLCFKQILYKSYLEVLNYCVIRTSETRSNFSEFYTTRACDTLFDSITSLRGLSYDMLHKWIQCNLESWTAGCYVACNMACCNSYILED